MKRITQSVHIGILISIILLLGVTPFENGSQAAAGYNAKARTFSATADYSSEIEKRIRSGQVSTADLIVDYHPRIWLRGDWDWDAVNEVGSLAWRIMHNPPMERDDPANDSQQYEFMQAGRQADFSFGRYDSDFARWYLRQITAAEAVSRAQTWGLEFPYSLPSLSANYYFYAEHTIDEYLEEARIKLSNVADEGLGGDVGANRLLKVSVGYDWLVDRKFTDGTPVLSDADRQEIQNKILSIADEMRNEALGQGHFFNGYDISRYGYYTVGLALYEPDGQGISASNNAKAKQYLDEFDEYWIGKILPVLNEQGGTGGWHEGFAYSSGEFGNDVIIYRIAPFLFAHYTATGQSFEESVFSTGALKYAVEFQNYMVYPNGEFGVGEDSGNRYQWLAPFAVSSRRRFSSDPEQQWLGELAGWIHNEKVPVEYLGSGSYDCFDQLMWEEKWPNPRSPDELGAGTRHFAKLGWVAMRSGFTSPDDLAALFISQHYHWSDTDLYAQNSFHIMRKGWLIEGNQNTLTIDGQYQRPISTFPSIADGLEAYAPGSVYDVGPGILAFESNDVYDYMLGDATNAYDTSELSRFTRQVVYLKPDIFVIFDRVVTHDPGTEKKWVVDPAATPQDLGNGLITVDNGSGALWIKRLLPTSASVSLTNTEIAVVPSQSNTETFFLHVMQAVDTGVSAGQVAVDDATVVQEGDWFHVQVADHQASFSRDGDFKFDGGSVVIKEDINRDGVVDDEDVQLCVSVILGLEIDPLIVERANVNGDGDVNALDIQQILIKMLIAD